MKTVTAIKIKDHKHPMYLFVLEASEIINRAEPDVYRIDEDGVEKGYQRMPERPRGLEFARFIEVGLSRGDITFPGTTLLAHRGTVRAEQTNHESWELVLPEKLFVVDGQHRLLGLKIAIEELGVKGAEQIQVPVLLIDQSEELLEAELFRVINETAKKVRTDLARRILALRLQKQSLEAEKYPPLQKRSWEVNASRIIDILNKDERSLWADRIQLPNQRKKPSHTIRDKSFGDSLRPLLTSYPFSDLDPVILARGINEFWLGVKMLMDNAPDSSDEANPFEEHEDFVLQKAIPGVFAMHLVLRHLWSVSTNRGQRNLKADFVYTALKEAANRAEPEARFDTRRAWRKDSVFALYGGLKGATGLAKIIIAYLKEAGYRLDWEDEG